MNEIERKEIIAYFSMEIGLESMMPTYSGGFGMLAGDTIRSAADMGIPLVALTLLHRKGYFRQHIDARRRKVVSKAERVKSCPKQDGISSPRLHGILCAPWFNAKLCASFRMRCVEKKLVLEPG